MYSSKVIINSHVSNLKKVRIFARQVLHLHCVDNIQENHIVSVIDEICANRIRHVFNNNGENEIEIHISYQQGSFTIEISDEGDFFDINAALKNVESPGLLLVKNLVDQIQAEKKGKRSIFKITKKIK